MASNLTQDNLALLDASNSDVDWRGGGMTELRPRQIRLPPRQDEGEAVQQAVQESRQVGEYDVHDIHDIHDIHYAHDEEGKRQSFGGETSKYSRRSENTTSNLSHLRANQHSTT